MKVKWTIFKDFVVGRSLSVQYIETNAIYYLKAIDGLFTLDCELDRLASDLTDVTDFETNFKALGNKKLGKPSVRVQMARVSAATSSGVASCDITIPAERWISGGAAWFANPAVGDHVRVEIHHPIAGKIGSFTDEDVPAGNQGWYLPTNGPASIGTIISDDPSKLSAGLILKIIGTKAVGEDTFYTNLLWGYKV